MAVAVKLDEETSIADPKTPEIKPEAITIDLLKHTCRELVVHAPEGLITDDLRNPAIWRRVQCTTGKALQKYDLLQIFACDGRWGIITQSAWSWLLAIPGILVERNICITDIESKLA